jgi:hypothetical protein
VIQAGTKIGKADIMVKEGRYNDNPDPIGEWTVKFTVNVQSDQVRVTRKKIEAPAVGSGTRTSQLYLMSNIGTDVYQNKMEKPRELMNARIAAVINNSFSAGYPMLASGEPSIRVSTMDLSNLSFRLVDGNFKPLKPLNPMYINLQVSPMDINPTTDISPFLGKLPRDRPTPREFQKQQEEQLALQMQQLQISETEKQKTDLIMKQLTPAQQLQFLALSPENQEYYRVFCEKQQVQQQDDALADQQLIQQLAQTAEARIPWYQKFVLSNASRQQQAQELAKQVGQEFKQIKLQQDAQRQLNIQQAVRRDVNAQKQKEQEEVLPVVQAQEMLNQQAIAKQQQNLQMEKELDDAADPPA